MDVVRSAFHAKLAAVMDSLLAAAVCEISKIFDSTLCEQQAELAHKTKEISILLGKLEHVEKMPRAQGGQDAEASTHDGVDKGKDASWHSEPKKESPLRDASQPPMRSYMVQVPEGSSVSRDQEKTDLQTGIKLKLSPWRQWRPLVDDQPQDGASPPFCSSPQPHDPCLAQHECSTVFGEAQGGACDLEELQASSISCSSPSGTGTTIDTAGLPSGSQEKQTSNPKSECRLRVEQAEAQQDQSEVLSSPWRPSDDSMVNHIRRTIFSSRDLPPPRSNSLSPKARQAHPASLTGASTGASGRPYTCPYCTKSFTYPSHQRRHLLRHTGVRLHPCQFCEKSFLTASELTVHTRTHTGERPFGCAQCGKRFARSGNLRAHQRDVHMRKRPFACTECGKRFAHRGNLRVHNHRVHQADLFHMEEQQEQSLGPV
uniref:zinc finger and SCAN domain-containing protein 5B-like n=1 Tax=Doryrhamphus excisus TaxID=161450 RepID=UPI0025AE9EAC|nr:zinc finger and SCAN domain-containing protein 5B-like [Doryrhamphus excisus]